MQIWTESEKQTEHSAPVIWVHVKYRFEQNDPQTNELIKNEIFAKAKLKRLSHQVDLESWLLEKFDATRDDIQFVDGLKILGNSNDHQSPTTPINLTEELQKDQLPQSQ